jgi:hypothetical protein
MTKQTASRATKSRVGSKAKPKTAKRKAKKALVRKVVRRTKSAAKAKRPGAKTKANPRKATSSVGAWPGLPPGYFERSR